MPSIFVDDPIKVEFLTSDKNAEPILRYLGAALDHADFPQGCMVGMSYQAGGQEQAVLISSDAIAATQNAFSLMRANRTSQDVAESGAVSCFEGQFRVRTQLYLSAGTYAVGTLLCVRYQAAEGGVLGDALTGGDDSTHAVGIVLSPPEDASANTPMVVRMFSDAQPLEA